MQNNKLPLEELSIAQLYNGNPSVYEVPIYQRNYAWEKEEIGALVQDVYDACTSNKPTYFIGTLVTFHKGDQIFEVIDGQQRLTTINITLHALGIKPQNKLTYRARKKSDVTINSIPHFAVDEKDEGIIRGYHFADEAIREIVPNNKLEIFKNYFQNQVHIIHYKVPKDMDLNHYFEVMNSRGEQLEKHEIIKARFIEMLNDEDKEKFNRIWEYCTEMNVYIQQKYKDPKLFGPNLNDFIVRNFDDLPVVEKGEGTIKIVDLLSTNVVKVSSNEREKLDSFQPIIDFSNFLLVVLKITRMEEEGFVPTNFVLDDKEIIREFEKVLIGDPPFAKRYGYNLLKAKYLLDNYIVHHADEEEKKDSNPWKLQKWYKGDNEYPKNLDGDSIHQNKLVQLLSMFEVTFTARQRKNYLFYCLYYLFHHDINDIAGYEDFVSKLARKYFYDIYLVKDNLNAINTPNPGSFDHMIVEKGTLNMSIIGEQSDFAAIYGNGKEISNGVPLFIFNYLDYKLWEMYYNQLRGENTSKTSRERIEFFKMLGCSDFDLENFNNFYFSRTRRSLEHFFPTANAKGLPDGLTKIQINCFGNYAMIGSDVNSSGSNWSPLTKLTHYRDQSSGKIKLVSVASLKFMIMMQKCKDNEQERRSDLAWNFTDIEEHQKKMIAILIDPINC